MMGIKDDKRQVEVDHLRIKKKKGSGKHNNYRSFAENGRNTEVDDMTFDITAPV